MKQIVNDKHVNILSNVVNTRKDTIRYNRVSRSLGMHTRLCAQSHKAPTNIKH